MALIVSAASGNFNNGATWVGGVVPGIGDEARADNGHTVTITANVTCDELSNAGTGIFTLNDGVTLTANVTSKSTTTARICLQFTAASPASATIVGNCTGGSVSDARAVVNTSTGTLTITGNCTGGSGFGAFGAHNFSTGTLTITGNCTGGTNTNAFGAHNGSTGTLTITGSCTGGSGATNPFGAYNNSTGTLTITGNCTGGSGGSNSIGAWNNSAGTLTITGNCTGGSGGTNSHGAVWNAGGTGTVDGDIDGSLFGAGLVVQGSHTANAQVDLLPGHTITAGSYAPGGATGAFYPGLRTLLRSRVRVPSTIVNGTGGQPSIEGMFFRDSTLPYSTFPLTYIDVSNVVTTQTMYAAGQSPGGIVAGDLRAGVSLDGGALVGTLAVPAANQVAVGVAVDNTVGTAVLTAQNIRDAIGLPSGNLDARLPSGLINGRMNSFVDAVSSGAVQDIFETYPLVEAYAPSGTFATPAQMLYFMQQTFSQFGISGVYISVKKLDGATEAARFILDDQQTPTSRTRIS